MPVSSRRSSLGPVSSRGFGPEVVLLAAEEVGALGAVPRVGSAATEPALHDLGIDLEPGGEVLDLDIGSTQR